MCVWDRERERENECACSLSIPGGEAAVGIHADPETQWMGVRGRGLVDMQGCCAQSQEAQQENLLGERGQSMWCSNEECGFWRQTEEQGSETCPTDEAVWPQFLYGWKGVAAAGGGGDQDDRVSTGGKVHTGGMVAVVIICPTCAKIEMCYFFPKSFSILCDLVNWVFPRVERTGSSGLGFMREFSPANARELASFGLLGSGWLMGVRWGVYSDPDCGEGKRAKGSHRGRGKWGMEREEERPSSREKIREERDWKYFSTWLYGEWHNTPSTDPRETIKNNDIIEIWGFFGFCFTFFFQNRPHYCSGTHVKRLWDSKFCPSVLLVFMYVSLLK